MRAFAVVLDRQSSPPPCQTSPNIRFTSPQVLKSRAQGIRDGARAALTAAAATLGPSYTVYLADLLRGLLTQGFQSHVLGYTLHAILAAQHASPRGVRAGEWDPALGVIAPLLAADIFGVAAEEKEASAISGKWKEARRRAAAPPPREPGEENKPPQVSPSVDPVSPYAPTKRVPAHSALLLFPISLTHTAFPPCPLPMGQVPLLRVSRAPRWERVLPGIRGGAPRPGPVAAAGGGRGEGPGEG